MITTDFVPGSPCWVDLGAPDVPATAEFYRAVLGWEFVSAGPDAGGYGMFASGGGTAAAVGPLMEEGARPAWTVYFHTDDAQATCDAAQKLGASVRMAPMDVMGQGWMAQLTDPQGGDFALWQGASLPGLEVADTPGSLSWIELMTPDSTASQQFYAALFGWTYTGTELPGGGGTYTMATPAGQPEERMHGGIMELSVEDLAHQGGTAYWHPVWEVSDCDAATAQVTAGGGSVMMGPEDAEGVGRLSVCTDPGGAEFVLLKPEGK